MGTLPIARGIVVSLTVLLVSQPALATDLSALEKRLTEAERTWDGEALEGVLNEAHAAPTIDIIDREAAQQLRVRAALSLAELLRIDFEDVTEHEQTVRTGLGQRIDEIANGALEKLELLPESSEKNRMQADLLATMMRSDFRARKYRKEFDAAAARALELDDDNPFAWVTAAKPFLFAGPKRGGDLEEAVRYLDRALELAPGLESALLLRAHAYEKMGEDDLAAEDRETVLAKNPDCRPAERALADKQR